MPKGTQKSNKEVKKPKQSKKPLPPGTSASVIPPAGSGAKRGNPPGR
jgi:hypothetical protein